ncbi:O-sialoglycoprotein endopeptidase [Desulfurobacterium thermolithotrophum DSM 11699]|uniref:tRNA N6-adenosine threonylcarbamoyltransferase n=1 Tax=Desulfurobacterium thermolithotrophum (strain DSM 11699 / BSA) TaxID=868864 RepID=F0S2H8_DESTD|nr:tRNA (adenosine(37)-N6)-threonylcarbamoyltransferase complex transferase subunit TsaD [Desulfurobacterium thermolithotrophum]ADY73050.1 O-sialoglycoprotein endopeptidase [Desulfurobacterium thermolithotrophum DSM 11699]
MIVLGIDTSCDDTSIAVYNGKENRMLSNIVSSQYQFHQEFGGVVPEIAARKHAENIDIVFNEALKVAGIEVSDIELVAVTRTPGLLPALLVGVTFGKGIAYWREIPLKGVHHIEAHIFSPFIGKVPEFPFLSLVVSGGHTLIVLVEGLGKYKLIGKTLDDAVGEAYDKVAKMLGLGYPGGPVIDKIYKNYDGDFIDLPKPRAPQFNFSFSGLKTAVRRLIEKGYPVEQVAASFQKTAIEYLTGKLKKAIKELKVKKVAIAGGVSANSLLRESLKIMQVEKNLNLFLPEMEFTSDNGAMVAYVGYRKFLIEGEDSLSMNAIARSSL